eukprot:c54202_g1_i1 orf=2-214(-)
MVYVMIVNQAAGWSAPLQEVILTATPLQVEGGLNTVEEWYGGYDYCMISVTVCNNLMRLSGRHPGEACHRA